VQPRASRSEIIGQHGAALKVRLQAPPVDGAANEALVRLLADSLGVPQRSVRVVAGATSRLTVHNSSVSGGIYGIQAVSSASGANAIASVGNTQVSGVEFAGLFQSGTSSAVLQSMGNNQVVNNNPNTAGTITPVGGL